MKKENGIERGRKDDKTGLEKAEKQNAEAMRLFGALSGVEEAYLAACEEDAGEKEVYPTACEAAGIEATDTEDRDAGQSLVWRMTRFARRYGMLAAAVLCVALLGTGYYFRHLAATKEDIANSYSGGAAKGSFAYESATEDGAWNSGVAEGIEDSDGVPVEIVDESGMKSVPATEEKRSMGDSGAGGDQSTGGSNADRSGQSTGDSENTNVGSLTDGITESTDSPENEEAIKEKTELNPVVDMGLQGGAMEALTLEEARQIAVAGAYLPEVLPSSGKLESVAATDTAGSESICVTWVYGNGWDSFFLTVRNLGKAVPQEIQEAIADVSRPETYDVRLYEIPYADSVPEEYRATFLDTVFRREDFGKACVEARIKAYAGDSGDTGTPRGNFRVLYQSEEGAYVLVDFNGRGSVEEIWSMINSVDYFSRYEDWMKPEMP